MIDWWMESMKVLLTKMCSILRNKSHKDLQYDVPIHFGFMVLDQKKYDCIFRFFFFLILIDEWMESMKVLRTKIYSMMYQLTLVTWSWIRKKWFLSTMA